jgi:uncharacterized protein
MPISHVVGFDDSPFAHTDRGDVPVIGAVFSGLRLDGVLKGKVRRDGANATRVLAELVERSQFGEHVQLLMLEGIALAGFNVVDIHELRSRLEIPVLVVARKKPDLAAIRTALLTRVPGGRRKWRLIERAGPMRAIGGVYVQTAGIDDDVVIDVLRRFAVHGRVPEPLRTAHLIAGGTAGRSSVERADRV